MKIHLRDGDKLQLEINGQIVKIALDLPDQMPETLPQLEIILPTELTCNLVRDSDKDIAVDAQQIIIPIPN